MVFLLSFYCKSGRSDRCRSGFLLLSIVYINHLMEYIQSSEYWKYKVTNNFITLQLWQFSKMTNFLTDLPIVKNPNVPRSWSCFDVVVENTLKIHFTHADCFLQGVCDAGNFTFPDAITSEPEFTRFIKGVNKRVPRMCFLIGLWEVRIHSSVQHMQTGLIDVSP